MPAEHTATTTAMARRGDDPARLAVRAAVAAAGMTLKQASRALGRNDAYLQQYLYRGTPRRLPEPLRLRLAGITGADQADFLDQALRALKKKMQREGIFREMKMRRSYEKPSERRAREKAEAVRRARKLERKRLEREGF